MSLRTKFTLAFLLLTIPTLVIGGTSIYLVTKISAPLHNDIPQQITKLSKSASLGEKALLIRYYDEVLTQSARNYAYTGDVKWQIRYGQEVPKLDATIKEALAGGDSVDVQTFSNIDEANLALIDLETEALSLVDKKDLKGAQEILNSPTYAKYKEKYQDGLTDYAQRKSAEGAGASAEATDTLQSVSSETAALTSGSVLQIAVILIISVIFSLILAVRLSGLLVKPILIFTKIAHNMAQGNFVDLLIDDSKDEIGELAKAFNRLSQDLKKATDEMETKVIQRTQELEKLNKFMVNRELKMVELKDQLRKQGRAS